MIRIKRIDDFINENHNIDNKRTLNENKPVDANIRIFNDMPSDNTNDFRPVQLGLDGVRKIMKRPKVKKILEKYKCVADCSPSCGWVELVLLFDNKENDIEKVYESFQNMLHELDLNTELYIDTEISNNIAFKGKKVYQCFHHEYKDMEYYIKHGYEWSSYKGLENIINDFTNIHGKENTNCLYCCWAEKSPNKKEYGFSDTDILNYAKSYIEKRYPKFEIELLNGKRSYDTKSYNAFVVSYKGYKDKFGGQAGSFVVEFIKGGTEDEMNTYRLSVRAPLGGEYKDKINIDNWKETINEAIDWLCN